MRRFILAAFFASAILPAVAASGPPTPAPIATDRSGELAVNGIKIHQAIYGRVRQ